MSASYIAFPLFLSLSQTICAVQPDVVVVELCQYRVSMLRMDENTLLREAKEINLEKVQQAIKQVRLSNRYGLNKVPMRAPIRLFFTLLWIEMELI